MAQATGTAALIVAAGQGVRAGRGQIPKQFQHIGGKPLLLHSLDVLLAHPRIDAVRVVIAEGQKPLYQAIAPQHPKLGAPVDGGDSRQESVRAGLEALADAPPGRVLIHDAARPFLSPALIDRVTDALAGADAVVPAISVASTLKRVNPDGTVAETVPREGLAAAETPQGFAFDAIRSAHAKAAGGPTDFTDDAAVAEWAGMQVQVVAGDQSNVKLTTATDIAAADRQMLAADMLRLGDVRVGMGYDIHPLGPGSEIWLGGVAIPHNRALAGHSDADVILHALTDAVLGAIGEADIGAHFPATDARWRGAASAQFLAHAVALVGERGGVVAHLDVSYVGQGPRISPYRDAMRESIATIAGIALDRVAVKATTNEGLGFIGRGEGAAAYAVATVRLPFKP